MCPEKVETESVSVPDGWEPDIAEIWDEKAFCPKHSHMKRWFKKVCSGCVSGWGECGLWKSFMYYKLELSKNDIEMIEKGYCPKRVNGTMGFSNGKVESIDLSEKADSEDGKAFVESIFEYAERYHKK